MKTFNWISYWERTLPQPAWVWRLDAFIKENADLDYFSLHVENAERSKPLPDGYAKYTVEGFQFEEDFNEYYGHEQNY